MAIIRPSIDHLDELQEPLGAATRAVLDAFAALGDDWTVYVRPKMGQDVPDFVLVHDIAGAVPVGVVDWRPSDHRRVDAGHIEVLGSDGAWTPSTAQPLAVARRHRRTLYEQFFAFPGDASDPGGVVRSVVALPWCTGAEAASLLVSGSGDPANAVLVWSGDDLTDRLPFLVAGPGSTPASPSSITRLHHQLVVDGTVHGAVEPVRLSEHARRIAANPGQAHIRGVAGTAGSGKSFALTARAACLAAEGKTVLVLCFNLTLADHLRRLVVERCAEYGANPARVTCTSFHTFCSRVVDDAAQSGIVVAEPARGTWPVKVVLETRAVFEAGYERRFDAVLVDEGQDFTVEWWNLLREHVVRQGGEMLLVADSTVDLYGKSTWDDPVALAAAGFTEPWIRMTSSYRMAPALVRSTNEFARAFIDRVAVVPEIADDQEVVVGHVSEAVRSWRNVESVAGLGVAVGREVVKLLREHPGLAPRDVVYLCEYHHDGLAAADEIAAAGYPVHHVYSRDPDERRRNKGRFWPEADAVKGCTVHSFKGWDSPAVVVGVAMEERSRRLAYASMTRVSSTVPGRATSYLVVVNADPRMAVFRPTFELGAALTVKS
ncbi:MAG TPA: UvrD-helicase domain-containing protein [Ilumatobacteraceae bacterium]|nr:UvrD-helicase domain-containing protein [Ilumatobacteraceae bacterium]